MWSWIGTRYGTVAAGFGSATAIGGLSTGHIPSVQNPLQHGLVPLHAPPGMQLMDEVHRCSMQSIGAWQSPCVSQTPPSTGFGTHVPYMQPNEQHSASAWQDV